MKYPIFDLLKAFVHRHQRTKPKSGEKYYVEGYHTRAAAKAPREKATRAKRSVRREFETLEAKHKRHHGRWQELSAELKRLEAGEGRIPKGTSHAEHIANVRKQRTSEWQHAIQAKRDIVRAKDLAKQKKEKAEIQAFRAKRRTARKGEREQAELRREEWRKTMPDLPEVKRARAEWAGKQAPKAADIAGLPTTKQGPQQGETKASVAGNTLVLRDERWHRVVGDEKQQGEMSEEDKTFVRRVAKETYETHGKPLGVGRGEWKRALLAGEHPEIVAAAHAAKRKQAEKEKQTVGREKEMAAKVEIPPGYTLGMDKEQGRISLSGPWNKSLHERIKRLGGQWEGNETWSVPSDSGDKLKLMIARWWKSESGNIEIERQRIVEEEASRKKKKIREEVKRVENKIKEYVGYVEDAARRGRIYKNGLVRLAEMGVSKYPEMESRMNAAVKLAQEKQAQVAAENAKRKPLYGKTYPHKEKIKELGGRWDANYKQWLMPDKESWDKANAIVNPHAPDPEKGTYGISRGEGYGGRQYPVGAVIPTPEQLQEKHSELPDYMVVTHASREYIEDEGMSFGVGDEEGYIYHHTLRPATNDEAAPELEKKRAREKQIAANNELKKIEEHIRAKGEYPSGSNVPGGDRLFDTQDMYGGGSWFVVEDDWIWHVRNNGMDGDDWSRNNVQTGGAGGIGFRMPYTKELHDKLLHIQKILKSGGEIRKAIPYIFNLAKAQGGLFAEKHTVHTKTGAHQQTYHVKPQFGQTGGLFSQRPVPIASIPTGQGSLFGGKGGGPSQGTLFAAKPREKRMYEKPGFKEWFKGSKVIGSNTRPMPLAHIAGPATFRGLSSGIHTFSSVPGKPKPGQVIAYLKIENPAGNTDIRNAATRADVRDNQPIQTLLSNMQVIRELKEKGHDGAMFESGDAPRYVVFSEGQTMPTKDHLLQKSIDAIIDLLKAFVQRRAHARKTKAGEVKQVAASQYHTKTAPKIFEGPTTRGKRSVGRSTTEHVEGKRQENIRKWKQLKKELNALESGSGHAKLMAGVKREQAIKDLRVQIQHVHRQIIQGQRDVGRIGELKERRELKGQKKASKEKWKVHLEARRKEWREKQKSAQKEPEVKRAVKKWEEKKAEPKEQPKTPKEQPQAPVAAKGAGIDKDAYDGLLAKMKAKGARPVLMDAMAKMGPEGFASKVEEGYFEKPGIAFAFKRTTGSTAKEWAEKNTAKEPEAPKAADVAGLPTTKQGPQAGETKASVAGNELVLRDGRWHRVAEDEKRGQRAAKFVPTLPKDGGRIAAGQEAKDVDWVAKAKEITLGTIARFPGVVKIRKVDGLPEADDAATTEQLTNAMKDVSDLITSTRDYMKRFKDEDALRQLSHEEMILGNIKSAIRVGLEKKQAGPLEVAKESGPPKAAVAVMKDQNRLQQLEERAVAGDLTISEIKELGSIKKKPLSRDVSVALGPNKRESVHVKYRVVDIDDLIASHDLNGNQNPNYTQDLQSRHRGRKADAAQIATMARNINPMAMMWDSRATDSGAPIIGDDMMVESGNGRTMAMMMAANGNSEAWQDYQNEMPEYLANYGIDPAVMKGMKKPVLVRERITGDGNAAFRVEFAESANMSSIKRMSAFEEAKRDAKRINVDILEQLNTREDEGIDAALARASNRPVVNMYLNQMSDNEAAALLRRDGTISRYGRERFKAALYLYAIPGKAGETIAETFIESSDHDMRNFDAAFARALPKLAKVRSVFDTGHQDKGLDLVNDIAQSIQALDWVKRNDRLYPNLESYLSSQALTGEDGQKVEGFEKRTTPLQDNMMRTLYDRAKSAKRIREVLIAYADSILDMPDPGQVSMFGGAAPGAHKSREEVWKDTLRRLEKPVESAEESKPTLI